MNDIVHLLRGKSAEEREPKQAAAIVIGEGELSIPMFFSIEIRPMQRQIMENSRDPIFFEEINKVLSFSIGPTKNVKKMGIICSVGGDLRKLKVF